MANLLENSCQMLSLCEIEFQRIHDNQLYTNNIEGCQSIKQAGATHLQKNVLRGKGNFLKQRGNFRGFKYSIRSDRKP